MTACTENRAAGLTTASVALVVLDELMAAIGNERLMIATVMPDHVHALFEVGERLTLSQVIGRTKSLTGSCLATSESKWQRGFFDRRLRPEDSLESFALYVFLNPYRAGLIGLFERWPWTRVGTRVRFRFLDALESGAPVPHEWLGEIERWERTIGDGIGD